MGDSQILVKRATMQPTLFLEDLLLQTLKTNVIAFRKSAIAAWFSYQNGTQMHDAK